MTSKAKLQKAQRFGHVIRPMPLKDTRCRFLAPEDWGRLKVHTRKFFVRLH